MMISSAVSEKSNIWRSGSLKNTILIFDKIYIPFGYENIELLEFDLAGTGVVLEDVDYLEQRGVIVENPVSQDEIIDEAQEKLREYMESRSCDSKLDGDKTRQIFGAFLERAGASQINKTLGELAVPVSSYAYGRDLFMPNKQQTENVMSILVDNFPIIHDDVPFDEVLSFRKEHKSIYNDLLLWVGKASRSEAEPIELREEITDLIEQFSRFQKIADLKFRASTIEMVFIAADLIKNLWSGKFLKVAKTVAYFNSKRADLLESELNNPGRPLAFVIKSQKNFK